MNVLFLCGGNTARSQMAEGFAKHYSNGRLTFASAGTWPSRTVHPVAVEVMAERRVDISEHKTKTFTQVPRPIHYIVALCGQSAEECPNIPGVETERWEIDDPAHVGQELASVDELALFRRVRDEIEAKVRDFLIRKEGDRHEALTKEENL